MAGGELEALLDRGGVTNDLGVEFVELDPSLVVATMPTDERPPQPSGYLHGGERHPGRVGCQHRDLRELPAEQGCVRLRDKPQPPQAQARRLDP